jgi:hypothetical protein
MYNCICSIKREAISETEGLNNFWAYFPIAFNYNSMYLFVPLLLFCGRDILHIMFRHVYNLIAYQISYAQLMEFITYSKKIAER